MKKSYIEHLDSRGINGVLEDISLGQCGKQGSDQRDSTEAWLRLKTEISKAELLARRDALDIETLSIAKEANSIARDALKEARSNAASASLQARWAMWAAIIATIAAIIATATIYIKTP